MDVDNILEMKKIGKSFPGVNALEQVDFFVKRGEIHALMGENGAGKSTLIKILTGVYRLDQGEIYFDGEVRDFHNTLDAQNAGISTIYQELNMIPYLSAGENIFLGRYPMKNGSIDWNRLYLDAQKIIDGMELKIDAKKPLNELGTATQQMISIARSISQNCKLVVMDEPTSSLDNKEVTLLFKIIRSLQKKGIAVIFISHRLDEIYELCERITVLKDGKYIGTYYTEELTQYDLVTKMMGRQVTEIDKEKRQERKIDEEYIVNMRDITSDTKLKNISIEVKRGEIVGLAGLLGSGRTETAKVLFGYDIPKSGEINVEGKKVKFRIPKDAVAKGLAFCTEDRREEGIIPNMSVKENLTLSCLKSISRYGFINRKKQRKITQQYIEQFQIKTPGQNQLVKNLSGGNQQKVILARWLATNPKLIILDEPTRGIDVGAKKEVEKLVEDFTKQGISVIYISSEMAELVRNCDRIYVLGDGRVKGQVAGQEMTEMDIMKMIAM